MALSEDVNHLTSPQDTDVIDVDSDTVHTKKYTPLKESDVAKLILKRDKLLKAIESSDSENDSDTVISPKKSPTLQSPTINLLESSSDDDPSTSNSLSASEHMSNNDLNIEFNDFTCNHDNNVDVVDDDIDDENSTTVHNSIVVHTESTN